MRHLVLLFCVWAAAAATCAAQCASAPASAACSGGSGAISSTTTLNGGDVYWHNSGTATVSNLTFNGGTLRVCGGTLTIASMSFNGASSIIVEAGAVLNISNGFNLNGGATVSSRGTINVNGGATLQSGNNAIYTADNGSIDFDGTVQISDATSEISLGHSLSGNFSVTGLSLSSSAKAGAICMGESAGLAVVGNITNDASGAVALASGASEACVSFTGTANLNQPFTANNDLFICVGGSASVSGTWGSTRVSDPCAGCLTVLPIELEFFRARRIGSGVLFLWRSLSETNNESYSIDRSFDGATWQTIATVPGAGDSRQPLTYSYEHVTTLYQTVYYRLRQTDYDGTTETFQTVLVSPDTRAMWDLVITDSSHGSLSLKLLAPERGQSVRIEVATAEGQLVHSASLTNTNWSVKDVEVGGLRPGVYVVYLRTPTGLLHRKTIVK